jgi:hypothetical protein
MIRICAWCDTRMGEVPPLEDERATHGICPRCMEGVLQELRRPTLEPVPPYQWLVVVARSDEGLLRHLRVALERLPHVRLVVDRRRGERRGAIRGVDHERRRRERRRPLDAGQRSVWNGFGVQLYNRDRGWCT